MMSDQYQAQYEPVSCEVHSNYELWIMHHATINLTWLDEQGAQQSSAVIMNDVRAHDGAEYLLFTLDGQSDAREVRLDRIISATEKVGS